MDYLLKPCPFCGCELIITMTIDKENLVLAACQGCFAQIRGRYTEGSKEFAKEQIIKNWNRRVNE